MILSVPQIMASLAEMRPRLIRPGLDDPVRTVFKGLSTDSRKIRPGQLFVALVGEKFDGHRFAFQALETGAAGVVVEPGRLDRTAAWPAGAVVIGVPDTLAALGLIARSWRLNFKAPLLAVTGSMGKSTVKEMAAGILSLSRRVHKNPGNLNNLIGLPLTLLDLEAEVEAMVVELGINQKGEMERLVDIARPDAALITNIGPVHLEGLGGIQGVAGAKTKLWEGLAPGATAVVNLDDPYLAGPAAGLKVPKITFSADPKNSSAEVVLARSAQAGPGRLHLEIKVQGRPITAELEAMGLFQAGNALAACAGALALGAEPEEMARGLAGFTPLAHRMKVLKGLGGLTIVDDSYNANPLAMAEALTALIRMGNNGRRKAAVLGPMAELGGEAEEAHRELGRRVAELGLDLLIAIGPLAGIVLEEARQAGLAKGLTASGPEEAARLIRRELQPGDRVLIKGSRVAGLERLVALLTEAGDEL